MSSSKTTAPIIVPEMQAGGGTTATHLESRALTTISATVLPYLKDIAEGKRQLTPGQSQELKKAEVEKLVESSLKDGSGKLDLNQLLEYMTSPKANAMAPAEETNLNYPISSYFISSSHNTYLSGNQLYGEANTEAYRNVLLRGCRCVEIDVWNGEKRDKDEGDEEDKHGFRSRISEKWAKYRNKSADSEARAREDEVKSEMPSPWRTISLTSRAEPRVLHGYTLTKEVPFRDVCDTIRDAAFVTSDLPVIVSLEIHTGPKQQEIMVEIMEEAWSGMLVIAPPEECKMLPTPAELKRKILVKVKGAAVKETEAEAVEDIKKAQSVSSSSSSEDEKDSIEKKPKKKKNKVIDSLSQLGIYTQSYHFKSLNSPEATIPTHVFSLSEKKLMDVHESDGPTLFSHNRNFLMRAFPSGTRVSSSNLDPAIFWRKGVQMVALNWQRFDAGVMLNEGQFAGTGGWVLKPNGYRGTSSQAKIISKESQVDTMTYKVLNLTIEILAAQDLPLRKEDSKGARHPYVKCELHIEKPEERSGAPIEGGGRTRDGEHKRRTNAKNSKGNDPDFCGERIHFTSMPVVEELTFVRFKIQDDVVGKDDLLAWACLRLDRLCEGYRFIHLLDSKGVTGHGVLLVNIEKKLS